MCRHEIIIDRYTHRQWLHYTGNKVDCDLPTCKTSPQHMHPGEKCACPQYVEDIEVTRSVHNALCPGCVENERNPQTYTPMEWPGVG